MYLTMYPTPFFFQTGWLILQLQCWGNTAYGIVLYPVMHSSPAQIAYRSLGLSMLDARELHKGLACKASTNLWCCQHVGCPCQQCSLSLAKMLLQWITFQLLVPCQWCWNPGWVRERTLGYFPTLYLWHCTYTHMAMCPIHEVSFSIYSSNRVVECDGPLSSYVHS